MSILGKWPRLIICLSELVLNPCSQPVLTWPLTCTSIPRQTMIGVAPLATAKASADSSSAGQCQAAERSVMAAVARVFRNRH